MNKQKGQSSRGEERTVVNRRYTLGQSIREEESGRIFEAFDALTSRDIWIKIQGGVPTDDFAEEYRLLVECGHPNLLAALDYGLCRRNNLLYYTAVPVKGDDLVRASITGSDRAKQFLNIFCGCCLAVEALHRRGISHFAVRPENLLWDGKNIRLINFSCASRAAWRRRHSDPMYRRSFLAPEILEGKAAGAAADWYAVGKSIQELFRNAPEGAIPSSLLMIASAMTLSSLDERVRSLEDILRVGKRHLQKGMRDAFAVAIASESWIPPMNEGRSDFHEVKGRIFGDGRQKEGRLIWITATDPLQRDALRRRIKAEYQTRGWTWIENGWKRTFPGIPDEQMWRFHGADGTQDGCLEWLLSGKRRLPTAVTIDDPSHRDEQVIDFISKFASALEINEDSVSSVVLVLSNSSASDFIPKKSGGVEQILLKPFTMERIRSIVRSVEYPPPDGMEDRVILRSRGSLSLLSALLQEEFCSGGRSTGFSLREWKALSETERKLLTILACCEEMVDFEDICSLGGLDRETASPIMERMAETGWVLRSPSDKGEGFRIATANSRSAIVDRIDISDVRSTHDDIASLYERKCRDGDPLVILPLTDHALKAKNAKTINRWVGRAVETALQYGHARAALDLLERAFPWLGDEPSRTQAVRQIAAVTTRLDSPKRALERLQKYRGGGSPLRDGVLSNHLAVLWIRTGMYEKAKKILDAACGTLKEIDTREWMRACMSSIAYWGDIGTPEKGVAVGKMCLKTIPGQLRRGPEAVEILRRLSMVSALMMDHLGSYRTLSRAISLAKRLPGVSLEDLQHLQIQSLIHMGKIDKAQRMLDMLEARNRTRRGALKPLLGYIKAFIRVSMGDIVCGREMLLREQRQFESHGDTFRARISAMNLSTICWETGEIAGMLQWSKKAIGNKRRRINPVMYIQFRHVLLLRLIEMGMAADASKARRSLFATVVRPEKYCEVDQALSAKKTMDMVAVWIGIYERCDRGLPVGDRDLRTICSFLRRRWHYWTPYGVCDAILPFLRAFRRNRDFRSFAILSPLVRRYAVSHALNGHIVDLDIEDTACALLQNRGDRIASGMNRLVERSRNRRMGWLALMSRAELSNRRGDYQQAVVDVAACRKRIEELTGGLNEGRRKAFMNRFLQDIGSIGAERLWVYCGTARPSVPADVESHGKEKPLVDKPRASGGPSRPLGAFAGDRRSKYAGIVGDSRRIRELIETLARIESTELPVLIQGESGTGKELVARHIHDNGLRKGKAFVTENCAAIPETLLESILFGHEKGAFTDAHQRHAGLFEQADGGTLFLDEIAEMGTSLQARLLRVVETGVFRRVGGSEEISTDVRLITATNRDIAAMMSDGKFRDDLYYRINAVVITLPPLRDRRDDVPLLVEHYLRRIAAERRRQFSIVPAAMELLCRHSWPGNVRELIAEVQRATLLTDGIVQTEHLTETIRRTAGSSLSADAVVPMAGSLKQAMRDYEKSLIVQVLNRTSGNKVHAARVLRIHRQTLYNKLLELGIAD